MTDNILDWVSIVGSIASVIGIGFTYYQVRSVKQITLKAQLDLTRMNTISELSKCNEYIKDINSLIKHDDMTMALTKMREVKDMIVKIRILVPKFKIEELRLSFDSDINSHINTLTESISSIDSYDVNESPLNKRHICKSIDNLSTYLIEISARLSTPLN